MARTVRRHHVCRHPVGLQPHPCSPSMGLAVARCRHQWRSAAGGEGARVAASCSSGSAGSGAIVVASSSIAGETRGRRPGTTASKASTTAPAASRMAHWRPEKLGELLVLEATEMASTKIASKRRTGIKRNGHMVSHLTRRVTGDFFISFLVLAQFVRAADNVISSSLSLFLLSLLELLMCCE
ncbi:hypothetical protein GQ55_5G076200 [Panicum hallii var. hallii]|uniref:Uncharacterized protein n=1 Tax=Panicum hallii var. hallii TaxID=1504633 RepID=A0A2T7DDV3_9POAL|nr:hypothetical protein GQ55_5G076200 [Panicum hallii var. hallii]